jgi:large subunit ribosomal protein L16
MLSPKRTKYRKCHRGNLKSIGIVKDFLFFGDYGIQRMQAAWLTSRQIEATRRVLSRYVRRTGKLWIRIFPDKIITARAAETRIGSGKGNPEYWVATIAPGKVLFELNGVSIQVARQALKIAVSKLPLKAKFVEKLH